MASRPPLSHYPSLCLFKVFRYVHLKDVISNVGLVCQNWNELQVSELEFRRPKLVLMQPQHLREEWPMLVQQQNPEYVSTLFEHIIREEDNKPWVTFEKAKELMHNSLPVNIISDSFLTGLGYSLANVTDLTIFQLKLPDDAAKNVLKLIARLLSHWSDKLIIFKFHFSFDAALEGAMFFENSLLKTEINASFDVLVQALNRMNKLKVLHLNATLNSLNIPTELKILSRLELFSVQLIENLDWYFSSIVKNAGEKLKIVSNDYLSFEELFGRLNLELASKFVHLRVRDRLNVSSYSELQVFGMRFESLTSLTLFIDKMPVTMLLRCLAKLEKLIYLKLAIGSIKQETAPLKKEPEEGENEEEVPFLWNQDPEDEPAFFIPEFTILPSIRMVTLQIYTRSHYDTELLCFPDSFPNLQVLDLHHSIESCVECKLTSRDISLAMHSKSDKAMELSCHIEQCLSQAREPFRACSKLHTVQLNYMGFFQPMGLMPASQI